MSNTPATIHIVAGPTASGKSAKAIELAEALDGVIINCDSVQVYNALPILTAQPSEEDKQRVLHRLYGELHPDQVCSAGNWRELAEPIIEEVLNEGKTPIICGGTGLYIRSLIEGLSPIPDIPEDVRERVVQHYETIGAEGFFKELEECDPVMAERFHVNHKARIIRAMEVLEATGKSLAEWQEEDRLAPPEHWEFVVHKIMPERDVLRQRCDDRFIQMLETGALDEVKEFSESLEKGTYKSGTPVTKALGFKALRAYLADEISQDEAITQAQAETRQYAKRQVTWFRNQL